MKKLFLMFFLLLGIPFNSFATCYLVVDGKHNLSQSVLEQIAQIELSRYVEPLSEVSPAGISKQDCLYRLTLTELSPGLVLVIKGPQLSSYAESDQGGIQGFQQALFKSIIKEDPTKKTIICQKHKHLMKKDCSEVMVDSKPVVKNLTVLDPKTGLTWQKDQAEKMTWKSANEFCQNLQLAGLSDWRLPNRIEIQTSFPIQNLFTDNQDYYWSSSPDSGEKYYAWGFTVSSGDLFSDWIKNLYNVRCVRGEKMGISDSLPPVDQESQELDPEEASVPSNHFLGLNWAIVPMYVPGFNKISEIYVHNVEEQGDEFDDDGADLPVGLAFSPYFEMASGLRFGARLGPLMYLAIIVDGEAFRFTAIPVETNVGYTIPINSENSKAFYFKGGISKLNASGEFVDSESIGVTGTAGLEILRNRKVSIGFEIGGDSASVKLKKYDCSQSATPGNLSTCKSEYKDVMLIGFIASILVIF